MTLYAIDPGTEQSALVRVDGEGVFGELHQNSKLLQWLHDNSWGGHLVVEQIASFGMPVGAEVFDTCVWIGRFVQAWGFPNTHTWSLMPRKAVKLALCGSMKAKDPNIRQALIYRYGGPQSVKKGGPLYGIKSHCWAALALAETYRIQQGEAKA